MIENPLPDCWKLTEEEAFALHDLVHDLRTSQDPIRQAIIKLTQAASFYWLEVERG